jgi:lipid-binding SYLF domain-containing protein
MDSPMKPWIINNAQLVIMYNLRKTCCLAGSSKGEGIVIARLPTVNSNLGSIQWSAPLFINIKATSFGISFGKQSTSTFAIASSLDAKKAFTAPEGRHFRGMDFNFAVGSGLQERSDVISTNMADDIGFLGVSKVGGVALDLSFFASGAMTVDTAKCNSVYGSSVTPAAILGTPGIAEFQPLYGELSRVVNTALDKRPSFNPGRTSASLERFSAGVDHDRVTVMADGAVIREDLKSPPTE